MRLILKQSLWLTLGVVLALIGVLAWTLSEQQNRLAAAQARMMSRHLESLARHCAAAWGPELDRRCLEGMGLTLEMTETDALLYAVVLDARPAIVLHTDFLHGDRSQQGRPAAAALRAAAEHPASLTQRLPYLRGMLLRVVSAPVTVEGRRAGTVAALFDEQALAASRSRALGSAAWRLVAASLAAGAVGFAASLLLSLRLLGPLRALFDASERLARGDLSARVAEDRSDELGGLAAQFNRMATRLKELDVLKADFVSKVTHDLRNPLAGIRANADFLLGGYGDPLTDAQRRAAETIAAGATSLAEMVTSLLDIAKLEAGEMRFEREVVDVHAQAGAVLELLGPRSREFNVALENRIPRSVGQVYAEPLAFRRVLTNLIANAIKFTPEGGRVTLSARRQDPNEIAFQVADSGIGIPKERLPTLFEKFSQVPETRNKVRPSSGTGLGLAICKEIVEAHGGRIWVESKLFQGARFLFTLPERADPGRLSR